MKETPNFPLIHPMKRSHAAVTNVVELTTGTTAGTLSYYHLTTEIEVTKENYTTLEVQPSNFENATYLNTLADELGNITDALLMTSATTGYASSFLGLKNH